MDNGPPWIECEPVIVSENLDLSVDMSLYSSISN